MEQPQYKLIGVLALILALDFLFHTILLLFVEPLMGFKGMGDYFDADLLMPALGSVQWQISNAFHMTAGILIPIIGISIVETSKSLLQATFNKVATFCGVLFFIVGISGFAALNATNWLDPEKLEIALTGFSIFRYTFLLAAVVCLSIFIIILSWIGKKHNLFPGWFTYFSYLIAIALLAFIFIPLPVPLILFVWSTLFGIIMITKKKNTVHQPNN